MKKEIFGKMDDGRDVELITLTNKNGTEVAVSTYGAAIVSFVFRDKNGTLRDVVLGYDTAEEYIRHDSCFGATVGRNANRIANARTVIGGVEYRLEANNGTNNLHSGANGVHNKLWEIEELSEADNSVTLKYFSADLEQGFPGNMDIKVTFSLNEEDALGIRYEAVSDQDTIANFTNHSYFNLGGHDSGNIGGHKLKVYSDQFAPVTPVDSIPTGEYRAVAGTPFDFTEWKEMGRDGDADYDQLNYTGGYDHTYILDNHGELQLMAEAVCEETGIHLSAYTDRPGVQFYVGNYIGEQTGKGGAAYASRDGFCLEAHYCPNAINNPAFPSPLLKAGETYRAQTVYRLSLD